MLGRTFLVILFFWAALTIVTPILIRMSASAKLLEYNGKMKNGGNHSSRGIGLLSRRALGSTEHPQTKIPSPSPSPTPSPAPASSSSSSSKLHRRTALELEASAHQEVIGNSVS